MTEGEDAGAVRSGVHFAHCHQGDYRHVCKYGDDDCPAAINDVPDRPDDASLDFEERAIALAKYLAGSTGDAELRQAREWACRIVHEMENDSGTI